MGILFTVVQGNILTTLMGNVLTEGMGKVLDIYIEIYVSKIKHANLKSFSKIIEKNKKMIIKK